MNIKKKLWASIISISLFVYQTPSEANKHPHQLSEIRTNWVGVENGIEGTDPEYTLKAQHLRAQPLFYSFDKTYFDNHMLPTGPLTYRNSPEQSVDAAQLTQEIEQVLEELRQGKKELTHFTILKDREFNRKEFAGLIVLKFKNYPFVLKLFAENPYSFLHPENKGFRHGCMSKMTGGLNRYLAGFSRISNLEFAQQFIQTLGDLPMKLDFPRKWFWQPTNNRWFELRGEHFADFEQPLRAELPEVYAIIADEIVCHKRLSQIRKTHGRTIFKLCQEFKFHIDPNMKNFRLEDGTKKLVLIDTEHFPSVLGFKGEITADNYLSLHIKMGLKAIYDCWIA